MALEHSGSNPSIEVPENIVISKLDELASWGRKNSLWPMPFATAPAGTTWPASEPRCFASARGNAI